MTARCVASTTHDAAGRSHCQHCIAMRSHLTPYPPSPLHVPLTVRAQERIQSVHPKVIILSGGPNSVHVEGSPRVPEGFFEYAAANKIPILGICYGMQVQAAGGGWRLRRA